MCVCLQLFHSALPKQISYNILFCLPLFFRYMYNTISISSSRRKEFFALMEQEEGNLKKNLFSMDNGAHITYGS